VHRDTCLQRVRSKSMIVRCSGFVLCHLLIMLAAALAQTCPSEKLRIRIAGITSDLQSELGPVRLHRLEELEDNIVVPIKTGSDAETPFQIYQVEERRYYLEGDKILQQVPWGRKFSNYIAVSQDGEHVYRLAGFRSEPEENFKHLVSDYHLPAPQNPREAESRALFCARVVFGAEPDLWALGDEQAKQMVSNHFSSNHTEADQWWRSFRSKHPKTILDVTTVNGDGGGYLTRLPLFWAPVESTTTPEIRELQVQVNRDGSCHKVAESSR
jgi:hypothetical protein